MAKENTLIEVRSNYPKKRDGGSQIALSETDPRHPNGHAFVASPTEFVKVFPTPKVREALTKKILIEKGSHEDDENPVVDMSPAPPQTTEVSDTPDTSEMSGVTVELQAGDTPDALAARYNKGALIQYATLNGVELKANDSAKVIAEKILSAA